MAFHQTNGLGIFKFNSFPENEVVQGVYSRLGGVSPQPWDSLNLGGTVGDPRENVIENRQRIFDSVRRPVETIYDVWQVHSADVVCVDAPRPLEREPIKADAILTTSPDVTLFMRFADCVPVLLFDPVQHVVGVVHSGWMGTVQEISAAAVKTMSAQYGSKPANILAGIGPSIGPDHYEIGENVIQKVREVFPESADQVLEAHDGRIHLNLWKLNEFILRASGVEQVEQSNLCTACDLGHWYSHRAEHGRTGRFAAIISLVKK